MDPEVQQRIVACLEACRYFGNPEALPDVIEGLNQVLTAIAEGRHLLMDSPEVVQIQVALRDLEIRPPQDPDSN
jgi:hypothetical protein